MKKDLGLLQSRPARMRFAKMSKEDCLKTVLRRYIQIGFEMGKVVGGGLKEKKYRKNSLAFEHLFKRTVNREATWAMKRAGVLPLEK